MATVNSLSIEQAVQKERIDQLEHKIDGLSRNVWYLVTAVALMMGKFILDNVNIGNKSTVAAMTMMPNLPHLLQQLLSILSP